MSAPPRAFETAIRCRGALAADRNPFAKINGAENIRLTDFQADLLDLSTPICADKGGKTVSFEWASERGGGGVRPLRHERNSATTA